MFVDFDKTFGDMDETTLKIPNGLLKKLNRDLPEGFHYEYKEDGLCHITSDDDKITFSGFTFVLTDKQKAILGDNPNTENILTYFYNAQKEIPLSLIKPGIIIINDEEVPVEKIMHHPFRSLKFDSFNLTALPPKFVDPFPIIISGNGCKMEMMINRIPNESIYEAKFESINEAPIKIKYSINDKKKLFSISIITNLNLSKNCREIYDSMSIYNAFISGKGKFENILIPTKEVPPTNKKYSKKALDFWKKTSEIENKLGVSFVVSDFEITKDIAYGIEHLYQNLIKGKPVRDDYKIDNLETEWSIENENRVKEAIGQQLVFQFTGKKSYELFGVKIELPCLTNAFNFIIKGYEKVDNKISLSLVNKSDEEVPFSSTLCFFNEKDRKTYLKKDFNDIVKEFEKAKKISELL